jgi:DNA-binding transcriptional LysR family regulator
MRADIDFRRLQHFVCLAEELNFTRAADRAKLSQTAFSRSIQVLESGFNVALFDRGTRSVQLTAAGRQLLGKAKYLLAQSRDLIREVGDIASADGGELCFGASLMAIDTVVGQVLPTLMQLRPRLKVKVEASHWRLLQQQLEQERIEFFVSYPGLLRHNPDFMVTRLPSVASSVFCRAQHPLLDKGSALNPMDIGRYPWASVQLRDRANVDMRKLFGVPADAPLPLALECNDLSLLRQTVLGSDMMLFTWNSWLQSDVQSGLIANLGKVLQPTLEDRAWNIECAIVQMADRTPSPAADSLIELIKQKFPGTADRPGTRGTAARN